MASNTQTVPLTGEVLGLPEDSCEVICPSCGATALTIVEKDRTTCGHYTSVCCWCLFSCCGKFECCKEFGEAGDYNHYCSKCGCFLGRHHKPRQSNT